MRGITTRSNYNNYVKKKIVLQGEIGRMVGKEEREAAERGLLSRTGKDRDRNGRFVSQKVRHEEHYKMLAFKK